MPKKILLVEDEAILALSEAKMLEKNGYEVTTAYSGEKAIKAVASNSDIDLILMDIDLGRGMDGTEAAQEILKKHDLPIAFLSSHTEPEIVEKTEGITSYGYIVKNSGDTVLLASIRMAFKLYGAHMELKTQKEHLRQALITQEHTEEELREKSDELNRYFTSSLDLLCIANIKGEFIRLNPEWERVLGYPITDLEGRSFMDFVHKDDREATLEALSRLDEQVEVHSFENRYRCKDGSYRWIEWRSRSQGDLIYAAARDITERKMSELRLRESEEKFRTLMEQSIDMLCLHNLEGKIIDVNERAEKYTGYSREELLTMSIPDLDPDYYKRVNSGRFWQQMDYNEPYQFQVRLKRKDSSIFFAELVLSKIVINNETVIMTLARDITERLKANEALRKSEEKYRMLYENAPLPYQSLDEQGHFLDVNPSWLKTLGGYSRDEVIGKSFADFIHPDSMENFKRNLEDFKRKGEADNNIYKMKKKNGEYIDALFKGCIAYLPNGAFERTHCVFEDITGKKRVEEELREKNKDFTALVENSPDIIVRYDPDYRHVYCNRAVEHYLGRPKEDFIGKTPFEVGGPKPQAELIVNSLKETAESMEEETVVLDYPTPSGTMWFETRIVPEVNKKGELESLLAVTRDITEREYAEQDRRTKNLQFQQLFDSMNEGVAIYKPSDNRDDFIFVDINSSGEKIGKVRREDVLGKKVTEVFPGVMKMGLLDVLKEVYETGEPQSHPLIQYEDNFVTYWVENEVFRLSSEYVCAVYEDTTEQHIAEEEYKTIFQTMRDGFWKIDENGYFIEVNDAYCRMSGYTQDELLHMHIQDVEALERLEDVKKHIGKIMEEGQDHFSSVHKRKDDTTYPVEVSATFFSLGERTHIFGLVRDVTWLKQALEDKEILMKELNHRVKNNLNMVSSLINLKEMELSKDADLSDLQSRIDAIRIIHEKLQQGDNIAYIDMREYVSDILNSIFSLANLKVEMVNDVEEISLETRTATAIGLIINEIATNALKYGFNSSDEPMRFRVELKEEITECSLVVANSGNPFPEDIDFANPETMGMYLVTSLVEQIDGSMELQKSPSPVFRIRFLKK